MVLSLTFAAGAVGAVGAWFWTLLIQVRKNSWRRLFGVGAGVGSGSRDNLGPKDVGLGAERQKAGLSQWIRGIVER